ncbi:MAG: hypothetical protein GDA67_00390 [Nitrospira sp. CR1.3]|nr:hypothetical protein [Nitrospira sp. CR1.3]
MQPGQSCCVAVAVTGFCFVTMLFDATPTEAQSRSGPSSSKTVTGEVSAVEGEFRMAKNAHGEDTLNVVDKSYVIITRAGERLRLELTRDTKVPDRANPGDRIEARISQEGQTLSVTRIQ